jgi:hypothetical protein
MILYPSCELSHQMVMMNMLCGGILAGVHGFEFRAPVCLLYKTL